MCSIKSTLIPLSELKPFIEIAFQYDDMLLKKFHIISKGTFEECVNSTYERIKEMPRTFPIECYKLEVVTDEQEHIPVGYTILHKNSENKNLLCSFGINIMYRYGGLKHMWLEWVGEQLGYPYITVQNSKNKRAIHFFKKNGFQVLKQESKDIITLIKTI